MAIHNGTSRRELLKGAGALAATAALNGFGFAQAPGRRAPNVVLIFCDDMGWGDLGCYGGANATPNVDTMAKNGVRFSDFYVTQAVCTASRAGLLTGCYSNRVGLMGALGPQAKIGLSSEEMNIAKAAKQAGMATGIFGKWHLGHHEKFLPVNHGFDQWAGVPYSHDMWPRHPENPRGYPDLPLMEGTRDALRVVRKNPDPAVLTSFLTEQAVKFIDRNKDKPFFLYVPQPLPHVPLGASEKFAGKSGKGLYGDVISELDWSAGQILSALRRNGIEENTLVIFASDNGPWTTYGEHAGSSGGLREAKGTSFEGGVRVPFVAQWPEKIAAGRVCGEPAMTIDMLPTLAKIWGAELPKERPIDGLNIWPLIAGEPGAKCPHEAFYFYWGQHLQAVRMGQWKLHFAHDYRMTPERLARGGQPNNARVGKLERSLFDLKADPNETQNVINEHPEIVTKMEALAEKMRSQLGDSATRRKGSAVREPGRIEEPQKVGEKVGA